MGGVGHDGGQRGIRHSVNEEMVKAVAASDAKPNVKYEVADGSFIEHMGQKNLQRYH